MGFLFTATSFGDNELLNWVGKGGDMWVTEGEELAELEASSSSSSSDSDLECGPQRRALGTPLTQGFPQVASADDFTHFNKHFFSTERKTADASVRRTVHISLSGTALMWMFLLVSSLYYHGLWPQPGDSNLMTLESIPMSGWPDPRFTASRLACTDRDHIYVSSQYQICQVNDSMAPVACKSQGSTPMAIVDLTAWCERAGCHPLVLRNGTKDQSVVVDCHTGSEKPLHGARATLMAVYGDGKSLLAVQDGVLVLHQWATDGWTPAYDIPSVSTNGIVGISVSGDILLLFHDLKPKFFQKPVELFDARTMQPVSTWRTPKDVLPLKAGCGIDNGSSAIVASKAIDVNPKALTLIRA